MTHFGPKSARFPCENANLPHCTYFTHTRGGGGGVQILAVIMLASCNAFLLSAAAAAAAAAAVQGSFLSKADRSGAGVCEPSLNPTPLLRKVLTSVFFFSGKHGTGPTCRGSDKKDSGKKKAHKHKFFCPVGPSFHRICPRDKPSLSLGQIQ